MTLTIDSLGKAREIWELLIKVPIDDESLYRYIAIAGLVEFEKACQQVNAHVRGCGKLPRNLHRWLKDHLHSRRSRSGIGMSLLPDGVTVEDLRQAVGAFDENNHSAYVDAIKRFYDLGGANGE